MEIQVNIRAPFEKSQQNVDMEKTQGLKIKPTKCEFFFLGTSLENVDRQF